MKKTFIYTMFLALGATLFCACSSEENADAEPVAKFCLPCDFQIAFDEDKVPYPMGVSRELSATDLKNFNEQVIGHGWKKIETYEIDERGVILDDEYFSYMLGVGSKRYYFNSSTQLTTYCVTDNIEAPQVTETHPVVINAQTGTVQLAQSLAQASQWGRLDIFKVFRSKGQWHMLMIQNEMPKWLISEYVQMTSEELEAMQQTFAKE